MQDLSIKVEVDLGSAEQKTKNFAKNLLEIPPAANKAAVALGKVATTGANQATTALTNLGRVVQDAPYGFIGIANNINPLLESFQRLKKESGTTGAALKSLVGGLAGAGGLGLAVSLGSAALSLFGIAMQKSGKEAEKSAEKIDEYGKLVQSISGKIGEQVATIDVLAKAYARENLSQGQRISIIQQLKQLAPEYFNQLKEEKTSIDQLTTAYNAYAESIDKSIIAELKKDKLKKLIERRVQLSVELNLVEPDTKFDALFDNIPKQAQVAVDKTNNIFKKDPFRKNAAVPVVENSAITEYRYKIDEINKISKEAAQIEVDLAKGLVVKVPDADKIKKVKEKIIKAIRFTEDDYEKMFFDESTVKLTVPASVELDFKKTLRKNPFGDGALNGILGPEAFEEARMKAELAGAGIVNGLQIGINKSVDALTFPELKALYKSAIEIGDKFKALFVDVAVGIGEGIGKAIGEGSGFLSNAAENVLHALGAFIVQLGKAAITASKLYLSLRAAAKNPVSGLIAGIAAVAIGYALQSVTLPKFAQGVENFRGGLAVVGERGPEVVRLPQGSDVIPNHRLGDIGPANMGIDVTGRIVTRGSDLVVIIDRARQTMSRNG